MPGREDSSRDMRRGDMRRGDMEEPEVEVLRLSPSDLKEARSIMRKNKKMNTNKRAQIFVQYFYRCLISVIEKNTDRHATDALGGIRIHNITTYEAAHECGFDEEDFKEVIEYIYAKYRDTYCRGSKFWYNWDWEGLNSVSFLFK